MCARVCVCLTQTDLVEKEGSKCLAIVADIGDPEVGHTHTWARAYPITLYIIGQGDVKLHGN